MKNVRFLLVALGFTLVISSCGSLFKPKYGCKSNGKNVGAEKMLSDPPKKTPKFKA